MALNQITAPAAEPVTVAEQKEHSHISTALDDTLIGNQIIAARTWAEGYCNRQFMAATYEWRFDAFPTNPNRFIDLPKAPLISITKIEYFDTTGTKVTWALANYQVDANTEPGRVMPVKDGTWPEADLATLGAVIVTFKAGYETTASPPVANVPELIKLGVRTLVAEMYERREEAIVGLPVQRVLLPVQRILFPFKVGAFGA